MFLKITICFLFVICYVESGVHEGPCTKALKEYEAMEPARLGMPMPRCAPDGTYSPYMYRGTSAICVSKDGTFLTQYERMRWDPKHENMKCRCARLEHKLKQQGKHGLAARLAKCSSDGSFAKRH